MRERYDRVLQLFAAVFIFMWCGVALASLLPEIVYVYFGLAVLSLLALGASYAGDVLAGRFRGLGYTSSLVLSLTLILLLVGTVLSSAPVVAYVQQTVPVEQVRSLQVEMIPHLAVLLVMFTSLVLGEYARSRYRGRFARRRR